MVRHNLLTRLASVKSLAASSWVPLRVCPKDTLTLHDQCEQLMNHFCTPFALNLEDDTYSIIIGLHDAILTMREHEVALVRLQPEYAYGPLGLPQIVPPASMVVFEVELCAIVSEEVSMLTFSHYIKLEY